MAQKAKNLLVMWKNRGRSLGQEDPLEWEMANLSSILAWRIPLPEERGGVAELDTTERLSFSMTTEFVSSCLLL